MTSCICIVHACIIVAKLFWKQSPKHTTGIFVWNLYFQWLLPPLNSFKAKSLTALFPQPPHFLNAESLLKPPPLPKQKLNFYLSTVFVFTFLFGKNTTRIWTNSSQISEKTCVYYENLQLFIHLIYNLHSN